VEQRRLCGRESFIVSIDDRRDLGVAHSGHSATCRIGVDSKRTSDAYRGSKADDGDRSLRNLCLLTEEPEDQAVQPEHARHSRANQLRR
jgi:hypothetical protein